MAKCKNCDYPFASSEKCPNCGSNDPTPSNLTYTLIGLVVVVVLFSLFRTSGNNNSKTEINSSSSLPTVDTQVMEKVKSHPVKNPIVEHIDNSQGLNLEMPDTTVLADTINTLNNGGYKNDY